MTEWWNKVTSSIIPHTLCDPTVCHMCWLRLQSFDRKRSTEKPRGEVWCPCCMQDENSTVTSSQSTEERWLGFGKWWQGVGFVNPQKGDLMPLKILPHEKVNIGVAGRKVPGVERQGEEGDSTWQEQLLKATFPNGAALKAPTVERVQNRHQRLDLTGWTRGEQKWDISRKNSGGGGMKESTLVKVILSLARLVSPLTHCKGPERKQLSCHSRFE